MTIPLMTLAGLSVVGGLVGFPIIKGANKFKDFLAPSITPLVHEVHAPAWFEITMMVFSMAVAQRASSWLIRCGHEAPDA
jgi:NADH:ubiquinone oxidoreductase subunit 5 (subunit L)/multisubunit Na+/H+ antiporter MnhA subunit